MIVCSEALQRRCSMHLACGDAILEGAGMRWARRSGSRKAPDEGYEWLLAAGAEQSPVNASMPLAFTPNNLPKAIFNMAPKRLNPTNKRRKITLTEEHAHDRQELRQTPRAASSDALTKIQCSKDDQSLLDDVDDILQSPLYDVAKDEDSKAAYESTTHKVAVVTADTKRIRT